MPLQSEQLAKSLKASVSGDVLFDRHSRALYATDASIYQIQPLGVVVPRSRQDVVETMTLAAEFGVPIVPRGGGTSLSGQSIGAGVVIDFSKYLNRIVALDPEQRTARVQPGVVLDSLNAAAAKHGLQFGPEVASSSRANLGGMIGNNSAGSRSIRHGKVVDHVIELETLLHDGTPMILGPLTAGQLREQQQQPGQPGHIYREVARIVEQNRQEIIARYPRVLRRVSGYNLDEYVPESHMGIPVPANVDLVRRVEQQRFPGARFNLAKLIVGAEGTLATVTEALVHLVPSPTHRAIVVLQFDNLADSVAMVNTILESGPSAVEMFDGLIMRLAANNLEYRHRFDFIEGLPESVLIAELSGEHADDVRDRAEDLAQRMRREPTVTRVLVAYDRPLCNRIWDCRKAAMPLMMGVPGSRKPIAFVEDTAVDPRQMPEFVGRFREILLANDTDGAFYGHASVGCLHIRPMIDVANREDIGRLERISHQVSELVLEYHGAMSGEHGDGLARSYLNEKLYGPQVYRAFQELKAAFDPQNRMNPGKVVDGPSPVANLRYGADYRPLQVPTTLDFSREGGLSGVVELCSGVGVCRKLSTGTMCPSFMVTGDEEHSTRGRANALRLVLSGALPPEELTGRRMYETFDLCLQCKGCKAECPSNVDVAKLKVEFLDQYQRKHGVTLGTRAMAHVASLNRWGSALAPLSNWATRLPGAAWLGEKLLRIDRRRPLPTFAPQSFQRWFTKRPRTPDSRPLTPAPRGPIVLLDDCLTSYCEPGVNRSATRLLEAAGYEVHLAGLGCCGRAAISKGLLDEAQRLARENIASLLPWAERGVPIVGAEPSCLLTLCDDYLDLVPGEAAQKVAAQARLIDSHLAQTGIELPWRADERKVLLHGHCHQKALVGAADTKRLLECVPGVQAKLVDSGCCGMAGSFGYEHYDVSMKIGERVLFPAVRESMDAAVVAPGFSCRHQIEHGTGVRAQHPVEFLAEHLADS